MSSPTSNKLFEAITDIQETLGSLTRNLIRDMFGDIAKCNKDYDFIVDQLNTINEFLNTQLIFDGISEEDAIKRQKYILYKWYCEKEGYPVEEEMPKL